MENVNDTELMLLFIVTIGYWVILIALGLYLKIEKRRREKWERNFEKNFRGSETMNKKYMKSPLEHTHTIFLSLVKLDHSRQTNSAFEIPRFQHEAFLLFAPKNLIGKWKVTFN